MIDRRSRAAQDIARPPARPAPRRCEATRRPPRDASWRQSISGRRAGASRVGSFDGERLVLERGPPLRERAGARPRARSTGTSCGSTRTSLDGLRPRPRAAASIDSVCGRRLGRRLRADRPRRTPPAEPRPLPRRTPRQPPSRACSRGCPHASCTSARASSCSRSTPSSSSAAMAADGMRRSSAADTLLLIPDLFHYWLCGVRAAEYTNATTTQCLDAADRRLGGDLLDAPRRSRRAPARDRPAGDAARRGWPADVADATGLDGVDGRRGGDARHRRRRSPASLFAGPARPS